MIFSRKNSAAPVESIASLINQEITIGEDSTPVTVRIEAANVDHRGNTKVLVSKVMANGSQETQWVDHRTLTLWLSMNSQMAA